MHAYDLPTGVDTAVLDMERYIALLLRAARAITHPLAIDERKLRQLVLAECWQLPLSPLPYPFGAMSNSTSGRGTGPVLNAWEAFAIPFHLIKGDDIAYLD